VQPALEHLLLFNKDGSPTPPALEPAYHMGIHTMIYNYFTSQSDTSHSRYHRLQDQEDGSVDGRDNKSANPSPDLYALLDRYLQSTVQDIFQTIPTDGESLVRYYAAQFERFAAGMQSIHRLLNYINRHYVKRAQDEDRGWLRMTDVLDGKLARTLVTDGQLTRKKLMETLKERRLKELEAWGYEPGEGEESIAAAECCAEAASPPDRIVHINALGLRRWRTELVEPLLAVPKVGSKPPKKGGGGGNKPQTSVKRPTALKSRLSRAIQEVQETETLSVQEKKELGERLDNSLRLVGLQRDHPLRRKLYRNLIVTAPKNSGRPR